MRLSEQSLKNPPRNMRGLCHLRPQHARPRLERSSTAIPGGVDGVAHGQEKPQGHRDAEEYV